MFNKEDDKDAKIQELMRLLEEAQIKEQRLQEIIAKTSTNNITIKKDDNLVNDTNNNNNNNNSNHNKPSKTLLRAVPDGNAEAERKQRIVVLKRDEESKQYSGLEIHKRNFANLIKQASGDKHANVISFLGSTKAGKSTTIQALLVRNKSPLAGPMQQKHEPTTADVQLWPCTLQSEENPHSLNVFFMDFEGKNSNSIPHMLDRISWFPDEAAIRNMAVMKYFPPLAYMASTVLVYTSSLPFEDASYVANVSQFAISNLRGVASAEKPALVLLSNGCSPVLSNESPESFTSKWLAKNDTGNLLRNNYEPIVCISLPNFFYSDVYFNEETRNNEADPVGFKSYQAAVQILQDRLVEICRKKTTERWIPRVGKSVDGIITVVDCQNTR
jgi:hypothetical protein